MTTSPSSIDEARALMLAADHGVLSTVSVKFPGYPFGSIVPFSTDQSDQLIVLISSIAQHTKNVLANPNCSITITESSMGNVQAKGRITVIGDMEKLPDEESAVKEKYYRYFEEARTYHQTHNFDFYRLKAVSYRYIGGFGKIFWLTPEQMHSSNTFFGKAEAGMIQHMNEDHKASMAAYLAHYKSILIGEQDEVSMAGVDPHGFDLLYNKKKIRFSFPSRVETAESVRAALVEMAKQARS